MDISALSSKVMDFVKKYRYVILILLIGIVLMVFPVKTEKKVSEVQKPVVEASFSDPTTELVQLLKQIRGVGEVKLLLTLDAGAKTIYQTDQQSTSGNENTSVHIETVIITDSQRTEQGMIQQVIAPQFRGAVVVCQGADDAAVRLAVVDAVSDATGLGSDRISVLKMK